MLPPIIHSVAGPQFGLLTGKQPRCDVDSSTLPVRRSTDKKGQECLTPHASLLHVLRQMRGGALPLGGCFHKGLLRTANTSQLYTTHLSGTMNNIASAWHPIRLLSAGITAQGCSKSIRGQVPASTSRMYGSRHAATSLADSPRRPAQQVLPRNTMHKTEQKPKTHTQSVSQCACAACFGSARHLKTGCWFLFRIHTGRIRPCRCEHTWTPSTVVGCPNAGLLGLSSSLLGCSITSRNAVAARPRYTAMSLSGAWAKTPLRSCSCRPGLSSIGNCDPHSCHSI